MLCVYFYSVACKSLNLCSMNVSVCVLRGFYSEFCEVCSLCSVWCLDVSDMLARFARGGVPGGKQCCASVFPCGRVRWMMLAAASAPEKAQGEAEAKSVVGTFLFVCLL